jgi:imidazole glycerol-phosphate synthase subunit HisH
MPAVADTASWRRGGTLSRVIAVIDYGMGNLRSVLNAMDLLGVESRLAASADDLDGASKLVLPGVGAFGDGMRNLRERGFVEALPDLLADGRPLLGLCLGMQMLADASEEHGEHEGLGLIPGVVRRLRPPDGLRVPHVGWNSVQARNGSTLLGDDGDAEQTFYFVHSYHFIAERPEDVTGVSDYGTEVTAVVERGSVMGTQFHPEKSQRDGLALLRRFAAC